VDLCDRGDYEPEIPPGGEDGGGPLDWRSGGASPAGGAGPRGATVSAISCTGPLLGSMMYL
jgi:hypothetical protein